MPSGGVGQRCLLLALGCLAAAGGAVGAPMKGISYGVSPSEGDTPENDDFMCDEAAPQWSAAGRGDLALIRALGANSVRLYGNDWNRTHRDFLDAAWGLGLDVIPGNSDWPFIQAPDNCMRATDFDCREQVRFAYAQNLEKGFLRNGAYHPALRYIVVMNEPDLKLPNVDSPRSYTRALISALDGMLEAEKEARVVGRLPKFTVTYSWSICQPCGKFNNKPGLGQMWELRRAMMNPSEYNYAPRNDLGELYRTRFVNSFNTANPAVDIRPLFLDAYEQEFAGTSVFVGEYHWNNKQGRQQEDIEKMLGLVANSSVLLGISYFEFQVRHDVGGHLDFGIFQPGGETVAEMSYFGRDYPIKCLVPVQDFYGRSLPAQVARAYGGGAGEFEDFGCLIGGPGSSRKGGLRSVRVVEPSTGTGSDRVRGGCNSTEVDTSNATSAGLGGGKERAVVGAQSQGFLRGKSRKWPAR